MLSVFGNIFWIKLLFIRVRWVKGKNYEKNYKLFNVDAVSYTHLEPFVIDGRSNFLFVNHKGKPKVAIDYNALFVRMIKKYNKHHKDNPLPHITPHTLRHTFCTRLASKNMNPKDLQYIMGHSNISITMNWYAHASIDTAKSEVQRLIA